jgi:predicted O-linked N-acetylglucosamine transferase (SPINDLY family)
VDRLVPKSVLTLAAASAAYNQGRWSEAEALYRDVLNGDPDQTDALHGLAILALERGAPRQAVDLLGRLVRLRPGDAFAWNNLGNAQRRMARRCAASTSYRCAVALSPDLAAIAANLAVQLAEVAGDDERWFARSLAICDDDPELWFAWSSARATAGRHAEALVLLRRAIGLSPQHAAAAYSLGTESLALGHLDDAERWLGRTIALSAGDMRAWANLGSARHRMTKWSAAETALRRALALEPAEAIAHNTLGLLSLDRKAPSAAARHFERALQSRPEFAIAHYHRGLAAFQQLRLREAADWFRSALRRDPDLVEAETNLASVLRDRGLFGEACTTFDKLLARRDQPAARMRRALLLPVVPSSVDEIAAVRRDLLARLDDCERRGLVLSDPVAEVGAANFYLAYHGLDDRATQERIARFYRTVCPGLAQDLTGARSRQPHGKVSIGFISTLLRTHTIGRLNRGLIENLDRRRFHVTLVGPQHSGDALAEGLVRSADRAITLPSHLAEARRRIAELDLDILYFTDIGMEPMTYFLAFSRLAPVQIVTWGHPDTTGLETIDWFLSADCMEPEGAEAHYTERLARLPGVTVAVKRPAPPRRIKSRTQLGLPDDETLYVCPQSLFKLHPEFDAVLARILASDPRGRLVFIHGKDPDLAELVVKRLAVLEVDRRRIVLLPALPGEDFLTLLRHADVVLDPAHYSGGHTSLEAFAMHAPIVTWPGRFMRARHTYGFYRLMGYEDLVAPNLNAYADLAVALGRDPSLRAQTRRRIAERSPILYDDRGSIDRMADFLETCARGT